MLLPKDEERGLREYRQAAGAIAPPDEEVRVNAIELGTS
jgi:hypothetical protein